MINEQTIQQTIDLKTKPPGSLGKLESVAWKICKIQKTLRPELKNPVMLVFAGDHGITEEGVSPYPKEVTYQMVLNFLGGGAAINVFCRQNGISLKVVDAGVDHDFGGITGLEHRKVGRGTRNFLHRPAMTPGECRTALETGRALAASEYSGGSNVIGFGEMGIGNTSSAALIMHKITGLPVAECAGRGTGHDSEGLLKKIAVLEQASERHPATGAEEILRTFGGMEIAMMCGAMLEARDRNMVLLIDGFIATSALLAAEALRPGMTENCLFCHVSDERGHRKMLEYLNAEPLVDLGMRLGEGTGAAVAYPLIVSAVRFMNEMASFADAGISNRE